MRKTTSHARAVAADGRFPRALALAALALAVLALLLARPGSASGARHTRRTERPHWILAAPVQVLTAGEAARVVVETAQELAVTVEWGHAPFTSHVQRSPAGRHHAVELGPLTPGAVYVVSVRAGGVLVAPPRPFVMPGAPPRLPAPAATLPM